MTETNNTAWAYDSHEWEATVSRWQSRQRNASQNGFRASKIISFHKSETKAVDIWQYLGWWHKKIIANFYDVDMLLNILSMFGRNLRRQIVIALVSVITNFLIIYLRLLLRFTVKFLKDIGKRSTRIKHQITLNQPWMKSNLPVNPSAIHRFLLVEWRNKKVIFRKFLNSERLEFILLNSRSI